MTDHPHDPAQGNAPHHHQGPPPGEEPGFFDRPANVRMIKIALYVVCAALLLADFVFDLHSYHPWEDFPAFYPIFGFLGIVVLVEVAKVLRKVVMRDEDYYDVR